MAEHWLSEARAGFQRRGTVGSFSAAADRAGMSTAAFARHELASPRASGKMKKRANFALNAIGARAR